MRGSWRILLIPALLAAGAPVLALADPPADEPPSPVEHNRQLYEKWAKDPEHRYRLWRDFRAFESLPAERQNRIRKLDHDLQEEDLARQASLWRVMERYAHWLERLPEDDRLRVEAATDGRERLRVIKEIRERQWLEQLPKADQDKVHDTPEEQRPALIAKLKKERDEWKQSVRPPGEASPVRPPPPFADLPAVRAFVSESLEPMLNEAEKTRLKNAEGKWPLYGIVVAELAERHPISFPGPTTGPKVHNSLPKEIRELLPQKAFDRVQKTRLKDAQGKWPDYAIAITQIAREKNIKLPHELGPCRPDGFSPAVQTFLITVLLPALATKEKQELQATEGRWPDYPAKMMDLAQKHQLTVPGTALPGPHEFWERVRAVLPDVPDHTLRDFALTELTAEERANLRLSYGDPASLERLKKEYYRRHPRLLEQRTIGEPRKPPRTPNE